MSWVLHRNNIDTVVILPENLGLPASPTSLASSYTFLANSLFELEHLGFPLTKRFVRLVQLIRPGRRPQRYGDMAKPNAAVPVMLKSSHSLSA